MEGDFCIGDFAALDMARLFERIIDSNSLTCPPLVNANTVFPMVMRSCAWLEDAYNL